MTKSFKEYWHDRSKAYDRLSWVNDINFLNSFIEYCDLHATDVVLDAGCGTGAVSRVIKDKVKLVVAADYSYDMMHSSKLYKQIPSFEYNLEDSNFTIDCFDKVICRMVFHHLSNVQTGISNCYAMLKPNGMLIAQNTVAPSTNLEVQKWYSKLLKTAKKQHTFTENQLVEYFTDAKFNNVLTEEYWYKFSVNNWIDNSGLDVKTRKVLYDMHLSAPKSVKEAYKMTIKNKQITVYTKSIFIKGFK